MRILINDGWAFAKLQAGSTADDAEKAEFVRVDLPHDWLIWQGNNLYETADVWYRRTITLPDQHDPVVLVRFDGVYMDCDILLNGEIICSHPYGYTAFDASLTGRMKKGENILSVHIRHQSPNSRWYSGSGIFRDVHLIILPENHLVPDSLYLCENEKEGAWTLQVTAETAGNIPQPFSCRLFSGDGHLAASAKGQNKSHKVEAVLFIPDGKPWSPDNPYLYTLEVRYGSHCEKRRIGLRSVCMDPDRGLLINGNTVRLKGVCLHHDLGALGSAFHEKAARRQLCLMKEMGANAVRTSHNPPASGFLDLCDEMGILVVDEAFDMWERPKTAYDYARFFSEWHQNDVASWIRRDRCHPCVIMWSIGNEIYDIHADLRGTEVTKILVRNVRLHDPNSHAFTTFGCNYMPWEGGQRCAGYVDAVGYNYGEQLYDLHHAVHPSWVIYGSETGSVLSSRGIYHFPISQSIMSDADEQCSSLGNSNTSWGAESLQKILCDDEKHTFTMGQFIWSGIDYIGEPTPYQTRSCYFGQADTACFPKDSFYLVQSFWTEQKMIHIGVTWDWNPGQMIDVPVITNCYETELFLNGISLGKKKPDRHDAEHCIPVWTLPYTQGELKAVGYDRNGTPLCDDTRRSPGETAHFVLSCGDPFLRSDGWDLAFVQVSAADRNGYFVGNARDRIKATVTGGGRLVGTDNGDPTDPDDYKSDCRRLFSGKLLLIIASNGQKKDVHVRVEAADGKKSEIRIPIHHAELKSGISSIQQANSRLLPDTVDVRKINIEAVDPTELTPENPQCRFRYTILPENASPRDIVWQVTNAAGIESPYADITEGQGYVSVCVHSDGLFYLRALCTNRDHCVLISQIEFCATGLGCPALNPYSYISAGLHDLQEGDIGAGNEKGIAFSRNGGSMIGFSCVDFGKTGSDRITVDLFALDNAPYDMELCVLSANGKLRRIAVLHYEKPSIWNVYQPETWSLPERLTGVQTLFFRMNAKIHMKGFVFEKQQKAYLLHPAAGADRIYGDSFFLKGEEVKDIGNNVTLTWTGMTFGGKGPVNLVIRGRTRLSVNTISIRIRNEQGDETVSAAEFKGTQSGEQTFSLQVPDGICTVSFLFLPGSSFDFSAFRFYRTENWTSGKE